MWYGNGTMATTNCIFKTAFLLPGYGVLKVKTPALLFLNDFVKICHIYVIFTINNHVKIRHKNKSKEKCIKVLAVDIEHCLNLHTVSPNQKR